jgi:prepilin-type N-terminal cleavage/methylation domain-containing protein
MKKGFTMIEMIIVVTIFAIIGTGVAASFFSGMKIWRRVREVDFNYAYTLISLERIAQELRQSVNSRYIGFEGQDYEVSFPTLRGNSIVNVTYSFDSLAKTLFRREIYLGDMLSDEEFGYREQKILSADELYFSYLYRENFKGSYEWADEWESEDGIFTALKIELEHKGKEYEKTVFVPIAE